MAKVTLTLRENLPVQFQWKKVLITVSNIVDHWWENGRWWKEETACAFYLVDTPSGAFLLCLNPEANEWYAKPVC